MEPIGFNLLIKPTLKCNARCIYCHSLKPAQVLSTDLLAIIYKKFAEFRQNHPVGAMTFNWHGGEPMLMGPDFYRTVLDIQARYLPDFDVRHTMQTNACLYEGETRAVLQDLLSAREIGACLDPFHPTRLLNDGRDYFPFSLKGCLNLIKDGFKVGMIYVTHQKSMDLAADLYFFFKNLKPNNVLFHPLEAYPDPAYLLTPEDWGEFLKRLWMVWADDNFAFNVYPLKEWRDYLVKRKPLFSCEHGPIQRDHIHLAVSPEGNIYPCHRYLDEDIFRIGNIREMSFEDIVAQDLTYHLWRKRTHLPPECQACEFVALCGSGCTATHDTSGKTRLCPGLKDIFKFMKAQLESSDHAHI